jgi:hypothetical protein
MDQDLASENVVPSKFLANNNITLTMEHFSFSNTPAENRNKKPPILFLIRPESIITEHPIDLNGEFSEWRRRLALIKIIPRRRIR